MADDILQRFLTSRLFDVGGDDSRLGHLRAAAEDIAVMLKNAPERIAAFTMVAIDPATPADEPILSEVAKALQNRWNSYAGAFADKTLPVVFRGIILNALLNIIGSEAVAAIVTMTARNLLPRLGAKVDEPHWRQLIDTASARLEQRARREWALPSSTAAQTQSLVLAGMSALAPPKANRDWLQKSLRAAAGPQAGGQATEGNPHWSNANDPWVQELGTRAGTAISASIDASAKALAESVSQVIRPLGEAVTSYVQAVVGDVSRTAIGLERRTSLIWWKEALFSPTAQLSYRQIELPMAMAFAAVDASAETGPFAPRMAEAFLLETVRTIDPVATQAPVSLASLCGSVIDAEPELRNLLVSKLSKVHVETGRTPLAGLIGSGVAVDGAVIMKRIGLSGDAALSPAEFALWLFRDLQASAAIPAPKARKRKGG